MNAPQATRPQKTAGHNSLNLLVWPAVLVKNQHKMHNHKGLTYEKKYCLPSIHVKYVEVYTNSSTCYEKNSYKFLFIFFYSS